jgi:hypothetical protein
MKTGTFLPPDIANVEASVPCEQFGNVAGLNEGLKGSPKGGYKITVAIDALGDNSYFKV